MGLFDRIKSGLRKTRETLEAGLGAILPGRVKLDEALLEELEERLLLSDVGLPTTQRLLESLRRRARGHEELPSEQIRTWLAEEVAAILREAGSGPPPALTGPGPAVVLVVGVNGVGKTTTIGKIARRYREGDKRVLLVACDTFRAAAAEQLEIWAAGPTAKFSGSARAPTPRRWPSTGSRLPSPATTTWRSLIPPDACTTRSISWRRSARSAG